MEAKLLTEGTYTIPEDFTVVREGQTIIVRPKKKFHDPVKWHCKDCFYLGRGRTATNFVGETSCCLKRKKSTGFYYSAYPSDKACYDFRERHDPRGC